MRPNIRAKITGDLRLLGDADWYVVRNDRGRVVVRKKSDMKAADVELSGPYETKDQARCEKGDFE